MRILSFRQPLASVVAAIPIAALATTMSARDALAQDSKDAGRPADSAAAKTPMPTYRFRFLGVYDEQSGEPLADVEVMDLATGSHAQTSKTGTVSLFFVPDGGSLVRVRKFGYAPQTMFVKISPADTAPVTVTMGTVQYLSTVMVHDTVNPYLSPKLRNAYDRMRQHGGGYFVDELTMRKWESSTIGNTMLANAPGLSLVPRRNGSVQLMSMRGGQLCPVTLFIDGIQSVVPADYSHMSVTDYAMAEYYPGGATVPVEFGGIKAGNCGVLLLWTRER